MFARTLATCTVGVIAGVALVLACGDDSPSDADASAVCDCPEAEPPLPGRIALEEHSQHSGPGTVPSGAHCDLVDGAYPQVLSGGCRIVDDTVRQSGNLRLVESYKRLGLDSEDNWVCTYDNATMDDVDILITLTCLLPAPASN